ncbi:MAG TPA: GNAT family N-acetyltransferase [Anaerolineae bacterium]|nr:GNAT family N-acetyltransferase [Anaerolineae bacterium]HMR67725.1 GNAT family N-acetyltransferase [Anaerolineae bacterium]
MSSTDLVNARLQLPPDLSLRPAAENDADFLFDVIKASMATYIDQIYGWNDARQYVYFQRSFDPAEHQIIVYRGQDIGRWAIRVGETAVFLANIQLLPAYQGQGLGSILIRALMQAAQEIELDVSLQVLKSNPAALRLYERLGFQMMGETETHYLLRSWFAPRD